MCSQRNRSSASADDDVVAADDKEDEAPTELPTLKYLRGRYRKRRGAVKEQAGIEFKPIVNSEVNRAVVQESRIADATEECKQCGG
jgi:hypothetical protein